MPQLNPGLLQTYLKWKGRRASQQKDGATRPEPSSPAIVMCSLFSTKIRKFSRAQLFYLLFFVKTTLLASFNKLYVASSHAFD